MTMCRASPVDLDNISGYTEGDLLIVRTHTRSIGHRVQGTQRESPPRTTDVEFTILPILQKRTTQKVTITPPRHHDEAPLFGSTAVVKQSGVRNALDLP